MLKTLKGKLSLVYIGLVLLIASVGFAGFFNLYRHEKAVDSLMTDNYKSISAAAKMMEAIERQDGAILIHTSIDRQKGMDLFVENHANFIKWYEVEEKNITEQGEKNLVQDINRQYAKYVKYFSELQEIRNSKGEDAALVFYDQTVLPLLYQVKQSLSELSYLNEVAMFRSKEAATTKTKRSMYFLLGLSFTAVFGGYAASRYFVHRFLSPLNQLSESINRVKAGELNQQLVIQSNDEIGKLAREFNEMTHRLQNYERSTMGQLMMEKNKSMAIVKSISDPLLVLDANYRIILINNACESFFDIIEAGIKGKHFLEAVHNGEIFDHITSTVQSGEEHQEKIIHLKRENDYYFNVVVTTVKDLENKNTGLIVVFQNVTELKELERVKTDFVATISHEFKTPLTSILMAASMLSDDSMGILNPEQKEAVDALKEDGEKIAGLVNELLELSRIESGRAVYQIDPCSVNAIVEASVRGFVEIAARRGIQLVTELEDELPLVDADFEKIIWVMNNLIINALKYTNSGDLVTIGAKADKYTVFISVKDTGTGILPEYIDHIFDKFVQVKGRDIEVRGTGLGLFVAREIVNAHKGEIWVNSKLDAGSTFTFTLPVSKTEVAG